MSDGNKDPDGLKSYSEFTIEANMDNEIFPGTSAIEREVHLEKLDKKVKELEETIAQLRLTMFGHFDMFAKYMTGLENRIKKLEEK